MTFLTNWVQSASAKALGWTLLHSLWEGAAIALVLAIVLGIARSSRVRYAAACLAMLALLAGFGETFYRLMPRSNGATSAINSLPAAVSPSPDDLPIVKGTRWDASDLLPWLAPLWLAGVLLFQLRCLAAWIAAGRVRRIGVCGAPDAWVERLNGLRARLRITRPVILLESCLAEVPVVIGHLRPVILMPVGLLTGMPAGQVESILLHELAHIRRADYLINLMQTVVEGLLFYHPAVWWISSIMRTERENCCDDLVVQTSGNAREYATALAALAENRWAIREAALAATGGNLVKRIQRLLAQPEGPRTAIVPALSAGVLVVTCGMALAAWQSPKPQISPVAARFVQATPLLFAQAQTKPKAADTAYDRWLKEEVPYIITAEERAGFGQLRTDPERAKFVEQFWERRNPVPGTSTNQFRDEHYRRIKYANDRFPSKTTIGWKTDRGRIYIIYGPPDEIESHTTGVGEARGYPFEQWLYRHLKGIGERVVVEFEDKGKTGEFRMISDPAQKDAFARPLEAQPAEMLQKYKEAYRAFEKQSESLPEPKELLNAELMALQSQLELKRLETRLRQLQAESEPSQRELLESQAEVERSQIELRRMESLLRELAERHGNSVFLSGSGPQVAVVILADRRMLVTIPFEFQAKQYSVGVTAVSAEGKTVWQNSTTEENHCGNGCPSNETRTLSYPAIPPGSYTLTAVVRDTAGSAQKTYVVHFTVN